MNKTLGEKCVDWCLMQVQAEPSPSITTASEWFRIANNHLIDTHLESRFYCSVAQSAALAAANGGSLIMEPHEYYTGVKQLLNSAKERGTYRDVSALQNGWKPGVGDLVIEKARASRIKLTMPAHASRIIKVYDIGFEKIDIVSKWRIKQRKWDNKNIIGFIEYPK